MTTARACAPASLLCLLLCALAPASRAGSEADRAAEPTPATAASLASTAELEREAFALIDQDPDRARTRYLEIAARYVALAEDEALAGEPFWRAARCYWLAGEILPIEMQRERTQLYRTAVGLAGQGIAREPDCAECMLWKFIAMGRIGTSQGLVAGLRAAPQMAALLDRGIALEPTHRDGDNNSTLGNLHYGSAIFYRVLPDWTWLSWLIGVRGDKERALEHARTALSLHPGRLDYRVEVASQLLCLGSSDGRAEQLDEGLRMLEGVLGFETSSIRDERQIAAARVMLATPEKSCGFTGADWVEIDARQAAAAVSE